MKRRWIEKGWFNRAWLELQYRMNYRASLTGWRAGGDQRSADELADACHQDAMAGIEKFTQLPKNSKH